MVKLRSKEKNKKSTSNGAFELDLPHARADDFIALSNDIFWEINDQHRYTFISKQVESYLHDPAKLLIGEKLGFGLDCNISDEEWKEHVTEAKNKGGRYSFNFSLRDNNGYLRHINAEIIPVTGRIGETKAFTGYRGVFKDITIEVNNSLNAELIEKRLTDTIECIPYGIALFDRDDKLVFANSKHRDLFPEMDDLVKIGTKFEDIVRATAERGIQEVDDKDIERFVRKRMQLHRNNYGTREIPLTNDRWAEMTEHITAEGGTVVSWTDMTSVKRREKALSSLLGDTVDSWTVPERAAKAIAIALGCRWAGVVRRDENISDDAEMVAMWDGDDLLPPFQFSLDETPCREVYENETGRFRMNSGVSEEFPNNTISRQFEGSLESYRGFAIRSSSNRIIGHIFAGDDKPFEKETHSEGKDIFRLIAHWVEIEFRRQHVQRKMIDSQTRFRDFAEVASDWFWEVDNDLEFIFVSSHAVDDAQIILQNKLKDAHKKADERVQDDDSESEGTEKSSIDRIVAYNPFRDVTLTVESNSETRILKVSGRPIFDINGNFKGYRGTGDDVTEMIEAMERATQTERWLIDAIESSPEAFALYDKDDKLIICNQKFKDTFFGEKSDQIHPGMSFEKLQEVHFSSGLSDLMPDKRKDFVEKRLVERHEASPTNFSESFVDGHVYMAVEHKTKEGGLASFYIDITELRDNERVLREAKEAAEAANRGKTEFLANISHELRTPLNAIIGFSQLIKDGFVGPPDSDKYQEYIQDIHDSGQHLLELINDILDLSKAEAGLLQQMDEETDIGRVLRDSVKIVTPRAKTAQLKLKSNIPKGLPKLLVDSKRAKQIFINLLSNAVKFTPEGGTVSVSAAMENDQMVIKVTDTGIGMEKGDLPKAMEAFGQVDSSLARRYEGTGLGLPLTKRLVEGNNGQLLIDSTVGEGTTVTVIFPKERIIHKET